VSGTEGPGYQGLLTLQQSLFPTEFPIAFSKSSKPLDTSRLDWQHC
jgi:hypothetical protein